MNDNLRVEDIWNGISPLINAGNSFLDSLIHYSEKNDIEIEVIAGIVKQSPILKELAREEAEELHMLEKITRLPV